MNAILCQPDWSLWACHACAAVYLVKEAADKCCKPEVERNG